LITRDWALAADDYQWILQERVGGAWRDRRFVRSKTAISRCFRRDQVRPTRAAQQALDALPETWSEWVWLEYEKRRSAARGTPVAPQRRIVSPARYQRDYCTEDYTSL
jgi:hypothetical protein